MFCYSNESFCLSVFFRPFLASLIQSGSILFSINLNLYILKDFISIIFFINDINVLYINEIIFYKIK